MNSLRRSASVLGVVVALVAAAPLRPAEVAGVEPAIPTPDSGITAQRIFGDVRFVMRAQGSTKWLDMFVADRHLARFDNFDVSEVVASPDRSRFLVLSNSLKSSFAYALLDRKGHVEASSPHGGDLHYCNRTAWGMAEWVDVANPRASFTLQKNQFTTPATDFLMVTVRGCDGNTVIVARPPAPSLKATAPATNGASVSDGSPGSLFIGDAIRSLRGLGPYDGTVLTLIDGRRSEQGKATALSLPQGWNLPVVFEQRSCAGSGCKGSDLSLRGPDGSFQPFSTRLEGDFIALPASGRILACQGSSMPGEPRAPLLVDLDGNRLWLPAHPGALRICARTGSGDEVLLVYTVASSGQARSLARVVDARGVQIVEGLFERAGAVQFSVSGRQYSAAIPGP